MWRHKLLQVSPPCTAGPSRIVRRRRRAAAAARPPARSRAPPRPPDASGCARRRQQEQDRRAGAARHRRRVAPGLAIVPALGMRPQRQALRSPPPPERRRRADRSTGVLRHRVGDAGVLRERLVPGGKLRMPGPPRLRGKAEIQIAQRAGDRDRADVDRADAADPPPARPASGPPPPSAARSTPRAPRPAASSSRRGAAPRHRGCRRPSPGTSAPASAARHAPGNIGSASPRLSRYSQITGLSNSATPSSVTSAGTFDSGLIATNSGGEALALVGTSSIRPSISRVMAQARTLRTYGLVGEK